ncbi:MAG: peptide deformylase [Flavobacteriales bacterium]|nr:peptide deformylase [Bacteroidota bacterium]MCB9239538.1 peptide deformylase [Flavobacteriales bacterium]
MIFPIRAFGDPVLRKKCDSIPTDYPDLKELINSMYETMDESNGVGLAAPQIGLDIRLFVIDSTSMYDKDGEGVRTAFINAEMLEETEKPWAFEEGCLSIPHIRENVDRHAKIRLKYQDENFKWHEAEFDGMTARVIQHEYDHIEGILFIDHISPLKRRLLKGKLADISKGKISVDYRMKFPKR